MKRILLAACLLAFARDVAADVIIGNSVSGPTYRSGTSVGKKSLGFRTESSALVIDDIDVALGGTLSGGAGGKVVFTLNADANGFPGAVLAQMGEGIVAGFFEATKPYKIVPPGGPLLLNPNTTYWIQGVFVEDPITNGSAGWEQPEPPVAPSSPTSLVTFVNYVFENGSAPVISTTYNAIVVNGRVADRSRGTAARAIVTGFRCGQTITPLNTLRGDSGVDTYSSVDFDHVGWSSAAGIQRAAPRVGAYVSTNNLVAAATNTPLGVGTGASRAIAFRQYRNDTAGPLTVSALAALDGEFSSAPTLNFRSGLCGDINASTSGSTGHATAAVYVFDPVKFLDAIDASGRSMPEYLLGSDTLTDYQSGTKSSLSLTRFASLSAAVIAEDFLEVDAASFASGVTVGPGSVQVAPGQSVIVVFDISGYSPPGASVRLIDTLKPAPGFMAGMSLLGGSTPEPPAATTLTLTPAATTSPVATSVTVTATATTASGSPVPNTIVLFDLSAGPNAQPLGPALTDASGQVSLTYAGGANAGIDVIHASIGALHSNAAEVTWTTPGPLDHITVNPASATVAAGSSQAYAAHALDAFDHSIGDVTAGTTFTISPDGSCVGATCTPSTPGTHTVTATYNGKSATATLNVTGSTYGFQGFFQPIDMSTPTVIVWNTVKAGQAVPIKWLLMQDGVPVSNPASFAGLSSYPIACSAGSGSIDDAIEQAATGNSGLQGNGDGTWQFNWQTLRSEKGTCRAVGVKFDNGTISPVAYLKLK